MSKQKKVNNIRRSTREGTAVKEKKVRFSVPLVLRLCHGWTQEEVAAKAGLTQPDICEMELYEPYGYKEKYSRLAGLYNVSLDVLLMNDFSEIREGTIHLPPQTYTEALGSREQRLGRKGEDHAWEMEKHRLERIWPALKDLVVPFYKIKHPSPGFDILSYDENGLPFALEVKTSSGEENGFRLTRNEMNVANSLTEKGINYVVRLINYQEEGDVSTEDVFFCDILKNYTIAPHTFMIKPKTSTPKTITGLAYYRQQQDIKQYEMAKMLGIARHELSFYETGARKIPVSIFIAARKLLGIPIDQLAKEYEI